MRHVAGGPLSFAGSKIESVGPADRIAAGVERVELPRATLIPGLIEGHSHLFLHPYDETLWDDQVLKEPLGAPRGARRVGRRGHAPGRHHHRARSRHGGRARQRRAASAAPSSRASCRALGSSPSPAPSSLLEATDPAGARYAFDPPQGAEEAAGEEEVARVVAEPDRPRRRLGQGLRRLRLGAGRRGSGRRSRSARAQGAGRDGARQPAAPSPRTR